MTINKEGCLFDNGLFMMYTSINFISLTIKFRGGVMAMIIKTAAIILTLIIVVGVVIGDILHNINRHMADTD